MPVLETNNSTKTKRSKFTFSELASVIRPILRQCTVGDHQVACTIQLMNTKKNKHTTKTPIIHLIQIIKPSFVGRVQKKLFILTKLFLYLESAPNQYHHVQCIGPVHQCSSGQGFRNQSTFLPNSSGGRNTAASPKSLI